MRLIQAGVGRWGMSWIDVVKAAPEWELVAVVDVDPAARRYGGELAGLQAGQLFDSVAAAATSVQADAVLVAVPPPFHAELAHETLDAGLHCIIEKPFTTDLTEAVDVIRHADATGLRVMVSQNYRFRRGPQTVKRLLRQGAIGAVEIVNAHFSLSPTFAGYRVEMDEPLIVDQGIHHFDYLRGIVGFEPMRVWARSFNPSWSSFRGNAAAVVEFEGANGSSAVYTGSWTSNGPDTSWDGSWDIQGAEGALLWSENRVRVLKSDVKRALYLDDTTLQREGRWLDAELDVVARQDRQGSLAEFAASIREGRDPETSGRDNMKSLGLMLAALESIKRREVIDLAELAPEVYA